MKRLDIPQGSPVLLGKPSNPMAPHLSEAIWEKLRGTPGIREAYLPQCFVKGIVEPPSQVLVLVLDEAAKRQEILTRVDEVLTGLLPTGMHLDVWPMSGADN